MIPVTRTFLPPIEEYQAQIQRAWDSQWMTNRGELVLELEQKLTDHLHLDHILLMTNGTLPLQIALKLLGKGGEIITTPFSYVATTAAIVWENCTPVFVDIHPEYLTIDETKIEAAITEKTTCILATHVFGNPCHIEAIEAIAKKHGLKVIYDAAHCFNVNYKGKSIFGYGDVSTCSFHATKLFHTGEGGAAFANDKELAEEVFQSHNFGHNGPYAFDTVGINAKMSELQAAMGLAVMPHLNLIVEKRKALALQYHGLLKTGETRSMRLREGTEWNYSYYPILFETEQRLLEVEERMKAEGIFPRRYFYPSLNGLPYVDSRPMPVSENVASRVLCLPLYVGLQEREVARICDIIRS